MATNWIGPYSFLTLEGPARGVGQEPIVIDRPGVNGSAIWLTGSRGKPFVLRSSIDALNLSYAQGLYFQHYRALIGSLVDVIWNGLPLTGSLTKAVVLDVAPIEGKLFRMIGGVGGLCPPSRGWIECNWKLLLITRTPS